LIGQEFDGGNQFVRYLIFVHISHENQDKLKVRLIQTPGGEGFFIGLTVFRHSIKFFALGTCVPIERQDRMIPWRHLDLAQIPGGTEELRLKQRGHEFSIMLGSNELMNSRLSGSEEALATLTFEKLKHRPNLSFLIGGLGMGFTLRAALGVLPSDTRVTVAELVPAVVQWAQGPMKDVFQGSLDDPRVEIAICDVKDRIRGAAEAWDAILLDVDNGPDGLTTTSNDQLYDRRGLSAAATALRPGGILAVWSSGPDLQFTQRLKEAGFRTEVKHVRATSRKTAPVM